MHSSNRSGTSGFTLVELMVVVAMVGILSAIAIPQYSKFVAKARQAEAKIGLAAAYSSLKSFAMENGSYTVCLRQAGYVPDGPNNNCGPSRYYGIGFQESIYGQTNCGPNGDQSCGYYSFPGQPSGVACVFGSAHPCCNSGWVGGGGCNSVWTLDQSDMQYPANSSMTNIGSGPIYPAHTQFSAIGTYLNQNQFKLGAVGSVSSSPSSSNCLTSVLWYRTMDAWTIDQDKTLINTNSCL